MSICDQILRGGDAPTSTTNGYEVDEEKLDALYERILRDGQQGGAGEKYIRMSKRYCDRLWVKYLSQLLTFTQRLEGAVFLDFGCKFGHLFPVLKAIGVGKIHGVDVDEEYLKDGRRFIGTVTGAQYVKSEDCFMDIQSGSVDFVLANEAISHINPMLLDNFYLEISRVLRVGGEIVICDGNNLAHRETRQNLIRSYSLWDGGESKEFGGGSYERHRRKKIREAFPGMRRETIEYYARNTSGFWGRRLAEVIRRAEEDGVFTERPHRPGMVPIHPNYGVAMERGFFPQQVELALKTYGLHAQQLRSNQGPEAIGAESERGNDKTFTVRGKKLPENEDDLIRYAP